MSFVNVLIHEDVTLTSVITYKLSYIVWCNIQSARSACQLMLRFSYFARLEYYYYYYYYYHYHYYY